MKHKQTLHNNENNPHGSFLRERYDLLYKRHIQLKDELQRTRIEVLSLRDALDISLQLMSYSSDPTCKIGVQQILSIL